MKVTGTIELPEDELHFTFIRASGPGGQNVNKVSTAVQLRFDLRASLSLPEPVKARVARLAGKRLTGDGMLVIEAKRFRTQLRNRDDAVDRLVRLIRRAAVPPKRRRKTAPSVTAVRRRVEQKKQRGRTKGLRRPPAADD